MALNAVYTLTLAILGVSYVLAFIRLVMGPSLADRVVAFDVMSTIGMGVIAVYAVATDQSLLLDVASVVALIAFLATLAFSYYLRRKA